MTIMIMIIIMTIMIMIASGLDTEDEGSAMKFLRRGYKRATWWEEELSEEKSNLWRS